MCNILLASGIAFALGVVVGTAIMKHRLKRLMYRKIKTWPECKNGGR